MGLLQRVVPVERRELRSVLVATAYGFCILLSFYILRPVRDEISSADRGNLQYLWTAVFFVMLIAVPLYSSVVSRFSRGVFIPLANRFFALNILGFYAALQLLDGPGARVWIDRVFYVWTSVFALFVVTVFWGFIADLFRNRQGRRVFGFIAMGSSVGGIAGAQLVEWIGATVPVFHLLLISVVPLEIAAWMAWVLHRQSGQEGAALRIEGPERVPGTALSGIRTVFRSSYLRGIATFVAIMTFASTILYFQQAELFAEAFQDRGVRRAFFASVDKWTNVVTLLAQVFLTAHVVRWLGLSRTLALVPVLTLLGFAAVGIGSFQWTPATLLVVFVTLQVLYRAGRYAIARPAREVLFTVVGREERYKSKAFIDAAVYRGGDLASGWIYAGLAAVGLSVGAISLVSLPLLGAWAAVGMSLGRRQDELAAAEEPLPEPRPGPAPATLTG
ncbi:MAG: Npt1/Npt2 family nucleotide transporter [Longimicrobiales bacterium]|nr:Npt1/Npt2 family nucleotide transporter [Longimicrobiales bacterium]